MAHQLTEEQKDALRSAYDTLIQHAYDAGLQHRHRDYKKWVDTASGMLLAGRALGFDLYADYQLRHKD